MKRILCTTFVVFAVSAGLASAQGAQQHNNASARNSDQMWVMNVAKAGMAEVQVGKLAAEHASSDEVKKFGQRMVDDHSKANDELKSLAEKKNITWPTE